MHAQQSFLNEVCNTAILGYHSDKIILYKNYKNIKYAKKHRLFNYHICQHHRLFKHHIWLQQFPEFCSLMFLHFFRGRVK
jgi:hypothetical protein